MLSRRLFLKSSAAGCALLGPAGNWAVAAGEAADNWAFPLLGDLHFDRLEHHDHEWLAREHPGDVSQVQNYSRITRELTPKLFGRVRDSLAALQKSKTAVPFVLQLGDLLEGLAGSEELANRHAREGIDFVRQAGFSAPMVITKGNHDITGPGATEAYRKLLLPFISQGAGRELSEAVFASRQGGTLVAFYDAYDKNSLDWFAKTLDETKPERLIVAIHPPVVPYNARSNWHIYSSPKQAAQRARLLELLGRHRAIVLCGHLHKYSLLVRRTDHGPFAQLAISSVAASSDGQLKDVRSGVNEYAPDLVELEPRHAPETVEARRELLAAERPFIERFDYADTWGHAVIYVTGGRISADIYRGFDEEPWKTADFAGLLS
jgi:calcineurin-like phosphoesterase family protein